MGARRLSSLDVAGRTEEVSIQGVERPLFLPHKLFWGQVLSRHFTGVFIKFPGMLVAAYADRCRQIGHGNFTRSNIRATCSSVGCWPEANSALAPKWSPFSISTTVL